MSRPVVMIATPCFGGLLTQNYVESLIKLIHYASNNAFEVQIAFLGHDALITRSRNTLAAAFRQHENLTHLMFIDADISFEPEAVGRLLAFDEDVVAGLYPLKAYDWDKAVTTQGVHEEHLQKAALAYVGTLLPPDLREVRDGFCTAVYAGTGFMLIKRRVLEALALAHPELSYSGIHAFPRPSPRNAPQCAFFECMIEPETGTYLSEDYAFCRRWLDAGGKIWLDLESKLTHNGANRFEGDTTARFAQISGLADGAVAISG